MTGFTYFYRNNPTCSSVAAIEDDYAGPKLENGKVTLAFMKEMMDWFQDQKKLHRKCAYQVSGFSYSVGSVSL